MFANQFEEFPMKYLLSVLLILSAGVAFADDFDAVEAKLKTAMASDARTDAEKDRDANRRPVETLEFFGLRDNMKIIELLPGGGWYTKLLVPVVAENGEYYAALGTGRIANSVLTLPGFEDAQVTAADSKVYKKDGARLYTLETSGFGVTDEAGRNLRRGRSHPPSHGAGQPRKCAQDRPGHDHTRGPGGRVRTGRILRPALPRR